MPNTGALRILFDLATTRKLCWFRHRNCKTFYISRSAILPWNRCPSNYLRHCSWWSRHHFKYIQSFVFLLLSTLSNGAVHAECSRRITTCQFVHTIRHHFKNIHISAWKLHHNVLNRSSLYFRVCPTTYVITYYELPTMSNICEFVVFFSNPIFSKRAIYQKSTDRIMGCHLCTELAATFQHQSSTTNTKNVKPWNFAHKLVAPSFILRSATTLCAEFQSLNVLSCLRYANFWRNMILFHHGFHLQDWDLIFRRCGEQGSELCRFFEFYFTRPNNLFLSLFCCSIINSVFMLGFS